MADNHPRHQLGLIVPTWVDLENILRSPALQEVIVALPRVDRVSVTVYGLQCTDDDHFEISSELDVDGLELSIRYDRNEVQRMLSIHEITLVPTAIVFCPGCEASVKNLIESAPAHKLEEGGTKETIAGDDGKHVAFSKAMDAYNCFHFSEACRLFSIIVADAGPSVDEATFNFAGLLHMVGYPTLAVQQICHLLVRTPDDMVAQTFLWNITQAAAAASGAGADPVEKHLLECCVRGYQHICEYNPLDVTAPLRLATLCRKPRNKDETDSATAMTPKALNAYARKIYEDMGEAFESRLVEKLGYRGPWVLAEMVDQEISKSKGSYPALGSWNILDVGCGSGLVGQAFSKLVHSFPASHSDDGSKSSTYEDTSPLHKAREAMKSSAKGGFMVGVDISSKMCEITIRSTTYSHVACCDAVVAVEVFVAEQAVQAVLDMIVVADTFIYLGPLVSFFEAGRRALKPNGLLIFSVEDVEKSTMRVPGMEIPREVATDAAAEERELDTAVPGWGGELLSSSRYAHYWGYVHALCRKYHFCVLAEQLVTLRTESTLEIIGRMFICRLGH